MKVDGNTGIYDGIIRIICKNKAKTIYLTAMGEDDDEYISLNDCLKLIEYYGGYGMCIVIFDDRTSGKIYQYGNYGEYWTEYGTTQGYA